MEVITIDSIAFQKLVEQLNRIESYMERTTELYRDIDDALEISTKDLMTIFCISESTLYRWRKGGPSVSDIPKPVVYVFHTVPCSWQ